MRSLADFKVLGALEGSQNRCDVTHMGVMVWGPPLGSSQALWVCPPSGSVCHVGGSSSTRRTMEMQLLLLMTVAMASGVDDGVDPGGSYWR